MKKHLQPPPKSGFTLIEMLIVVSIVALLAAMVFRMLGVGGLNSDRAKAQATLQKVANALEEFRSIYGKYPPVKVYHDAGGNTFQPSYYEFCNAASFSESVAKQIRNADQKKKIAWTAKNDEEGGRLFTFGLASFFIPRYNGTADTGPIIFAGVENRKQLASQAVRQWSDDNKKNGNRVGDTNRDINAVRKILPHLGGQLGPDGKISNNGILSLWESISYLNCSAFKGPFTNALYSIRDPWNHHINYRSLPPYDTYRLWSSGPDGQSGTNDDIELDR